MCQGPVPGWHGVSKSDVPWRKECRSPDARPPSATSHDERSKIPQVERWSTWAETVWSETSIVEGTGSHVPVAGSKYARTRPPVGALAGTGNVNVTGVLKEVADVSM